MDEPAFSVSEFVEVFNQTLDYAYPAVMVSGELANFRVSKNKWVYFDLKDDQASLRCFGTVYQLPGPLEDGMMLTVRAQPRLHPLYNFSLNVQAMQVQGEGSLKRAADLLAAKLQAEGLFDADRKRPLPYPPRHIGLVTSGESAAYHDFIKVLQARWGGLHITLADTQVQGEAAIAQIVSAIERHNSSAQPPDVLVITRGGGSADDLAAFSTEPVVRAIAASRIPTLVAIGHEIDVSLAELAADKRASTPSNAAELIVPDKHQAIKQIQADTRRMVRLFKDLIRVERAELTEIKESFAQVSRRQLAQATTNLQAHQRLLKALNPYAALERGFAIVRADGQLLRSGKQLRAGQAIELQFTDGKRQATIQS